jgi:hypothetical protein
MHRMISQQKKSFNKKHLAGIAIIPFSVVLISCGEKKPYVPPTPVGITQFTEAYKNFPYCDSEKPICAEQRRAGYESGRATNSRLWGSGRPLAPFVMRVDSIRGEGNTWTMDGSVVWDAAAEDASAMTKVGLLAGIMSMADGASLLQGASIVGTVASSSYTKVGNCLTSTESQPIPKTMLEVENLKVTITDLNGFEKGGYVQVNAPMAQFADFNKKKSGWDEASIFRTGSTNSFGTVELWPREKFKGTIATAKVVQVEKPTAFCKEED